MEEVERRLEQPPRAAATPGIPAFHGTCASYASSGDAMDGGGRATPGAVAGTAAERAPSNRPKLFHVIPLKVPARAGYSGYAMGPCFTMGPAPRKPPYTKGPEGTGQLTPRT